MSAIDTVRQWLRVSEYWMLEGLFLAVVVSTWMALPAMLRAIPAGRRWWWGSAALAATALVLVTVLPPTTNRIFYDEQIYEDVGRNLAELRLSQTCHHGIVEYGRLECLAAEINKEPSGYPYLLSVGYRLFGVGEPVAHGLNRLCHVLVVWLVAIAAARVFGDPGAGLFAGLALTLMPEQLRWSATAAAEPSAALFCLLAVTATFEFCRARTTRALVWAVCSLAFAVHLRPEAALVLPVAAAVVSLEAPKELRTARLWWAAAAGLALLAPFVGRVLAVRGEGWGATGGGPFGLAYVASNLAVNAPFYVWDGRFPGWLFPFAVLGALAGRAAGRARVAMGIAALAFWGIFIVFYAGSYDYGADVRYSLMTYPPLACFIGLGLSTAVRAVSARTGRAGAIRVALVAAMGWAFLWQAPLVRAVGEEAWAARADVDFARAVAADLPANALVLTQDPNMFLVWGRSAAQMVLAVNDPQFLPNAARRHGGQVYVHWGFWCNVEDPQQRQMCADARALAPSQLVRERTVRTYRYALYRLDLPR